MKYKLEFLSTNLHGKPWKSVPRQHLLIFFLSISVTQIRMLHVATQGWTMNSETSKARSQVSYHSEN